MTVIDIPDVSPFHPDLENVLYIKADITDEDQMDGAFESAIEKFGPVETCIALAALDLSVLPQNDSLADMDPAVWRRVFNVNVYGTFLTCQRWLRGVRAATRHQEEAEKLSNVNFIIMGSEAARFGVRTMAAYAASKSAVQGGMLYSLALDAPRVFARARVNAVAPGAVDTARFRGECERGGSEWKWKECEAT